MLAATVAARKKPQALKIDLFYQGRFNIMRKSVHKLGSFTTALEATVKAGKKPQALKIDLGVQGRYSGKPNSVIL